MKKKLEAIVKKGKFEDKETIEILINDDLTKAFIVRNDYNNIDLFVDYLKELTILGYTIKFE